MSTGRSASAMRPSTCGRRNTTEVRELRLLREENAKLKRLVADLTLDKHILGECRRDEHAKVLEGNAVKHLSSLTAQLLVHFQRCLRERCLSYFYQVAV